MPAAPPWSLEGAASWNKPVRCAVFCAHIQFRRTVVSEELSRPRRRALERPNIIDRVAGPGAVALVLATAVITLSAASVYAVTAGERPAGDPAHGKTVYQACMGCHSLDEDDVGPRHRGVVGRVAGSVPGYAYSAALKGSHIVWSTEDRKSVV